MAKPPTSGRTVAEVVKSVEHSAARRKKAHEKLAAEIAARVPREGYEPCIVSFIDVLGFRDLLATRHAHDIRDILLRLRKFTTPDKVEKPRRIRDARLYSRPFADSVSDAVVRVRVYDTQYRDGAFFHELLDLLHAQIQCVVSGVVIRAGVTIGDAHVGLNGKGPVFGPAMVRAYEIETHKAVHPVLSSIKAPMRRSSPTPACTKKATAPGRKSAMSTSCCASTSRARGLYTPTH